MDAGWYRDAETTYLKAPRASARPEANVAWEALPELAVVSPTSGTTTLLRATTPGTFRIRIVDWKSTQACSPDLAVLTGPPVGIAVFASLLGGTALGSLSVGGLSNAWGCGVAAYNSRELAQFPFAADELQDSYARVAAQTGLSGACDDDLAGYFGVDRWAEPAFELDEGHGLLWGRYQRARAPEPRPVPARPRAGGGAAPSAGRAATAVTVLLRKNFRPCLSCLVLAECSQVVIRL